MHTLAPCVCTRLEPTLGHQDTLLSGGHPLTLYRASALCVHARERVILRVFACRPAPLVCCWRSVPWTFESSLVLTSTEMSLLGAQYNLTWLSCCHRKRSNHEAFALLWPMVPLTNGPQQWAAVRMMIM
jgi:hypothetical protein